MSMNMCAHNHFQCNILWIQHDEGDAGDAGDEGDEGDEGDGGAEGDEGDIKGYSEHHCILYARISTSSLYPLLL